MRILHVNYSDRMGGAARAAFRINRSLNELAGVDSRMLVWSRSSDAGDVIAFSPQQSLFARVRRAFRNHADAQLAKPWGEFNSPSNSYLSRADIRTNLLQSVDLREYDLVNLHWLGKGTLSVEEVGKIERPVVWTMHDMWPFCGAEHYAPDRPEARFRVGYRADNRAEDESGPDMNRSVWERKRTAWKKPITAVGPSQWICQCARQSILFRNQPIVHIPNPIDVGFWCPQDQVVARRALGIPEGKKVLLFGSVGGEADPRKGADLMHAALQWLVSRMNGEIHLIVFGQEEPENVPILQYKSTYLGPIDDDSRMVNVYNAADVMIVPSRQDNQPLTAVEAQACGLPVVAFGVGGLPEIVDHRITGAIAEPFDPAKMADCIAWVLSDPARHRALCDASRAKAVREFSEEVVAGQYLTLYERVLTDAKP